MNPNILVVFLNKRVELKAQLIQFHSQLVTKEFQQQILRNVVAESQSGGLVFIQVVDEGSHVVESLKIFQAKIDILEELGEDALDHVLIF